VTTPRRSHPGLVREVSRSSFAWGEYRGEGSVRRFCLGSRVACSAVKRVRTGCHCSCHRYEMRNRWETMLRYKTWADLIVSPSDLNRTRYRVWSSDPGISRLWWKIRFQLTNFVEGLGPANKKLWPLIRATVRMMGPSGRERRAWAASKFFEHKSGFCTLFHTWWPS